MSEMLGPYRVVDLTKKLYPEREKRRLEVRRFFKEETKDYHSDLDIASHLGTHVETPYHYKDEWPDVLQLPTTSFLGRGVLLHLDDIQPCAPVRARDLEKADKGRLQEGDVVVLTSPYHCEPFSFREDDQRPYLGAAAGQWLADKGIKSVGFGDSVAIEHSVEDACAFHEILMPRDVTFIEVMENLDKLEDDIFLIVFLPLPIAGLDSCPVRVVAIEGVPGFSPGE